MNEDAEENRADGSVDNVQKKITPWKQMLPDVDSLAISSNRKKNNANSPIDLIVIASLIDRLPNLGGLCRTCEVLGVKHLVLSSLRMTEDRDFVSLSVSAEKWMNILEVINLIPLFYRSSFSIKKKLYILFDKNYFGVF